MKSIKEPQAHRLHAMHQHAAETQAMIYALMLFIQRQFGADALVAINDSVEDALEADHAVP